MSQFGGHFRFSSQRSHRGAKARRDAGMGIRIIDGGGAAFDSKNGLDTTP